MSLKLKSGYPLSLIKYGLPNDYPKLDKDINCEVLIIGGGISGALTAYTLTENNIDCVLVDARTIGLGSTCASTSLIQYEIDVPLFKLMKMIGRQKAILAYQLCRDGVYKLEEISKKIGFNNFSKKKSLFIASEKRDRNFIEDEYKARKEAQLNVEYLNQNEFSKLSGIANTNAIVSMDAAEADAYLFTHALLQFSMKKGLKVYDRTKIINRDSENGKVKLKTENGFSVNARKIIYATGYEAVEIIERSLVKLNSTYAVASEQADLSEFWFKDYLVWETAMPYFYLRTTSDNRIIFGGGDNKFTTAERSNKLIAKKTKKLVKDFSRLTDKVILKPEFSWTGIFGSTKDGLPYIGQYKKIAHTYFALGFGGNGIVFSLIAAEIILDLLSGRNNQYRDIFSFDR